MPFSNYFYHPDTAGDTAKGLKMGASAVGLLMVAWARFSTFDTGQCVFRVEKTSSTHLLGNCTIAKMQHMKSIRSFVENQPMLFFLILTISVPVVAAILTLKSPFQIFTFSGKQDLATAINGLCAPAIGLITSFLLFLTLHEQIKNTKLLNEQKELDMLFTMMTQLEKYIESISLVYTIREKSKIEDKRFLGVEALLKFAYKQKFEKVTPPIPLGAYHTTPQIILVIRSYNHLKKRIEMSKLEDEIKKSFIDKIDIIKYSVLYKPLQNLVELEKDPGFVKDYAWYEINNFIQADNNEVLAKYMTKED